MKKKQSVKLKRTERKAMAKGSLSVITQGTVISQYLLYLQQNFRA